ncbi:Flp family type IVb pilin [Nesterenkonia sp. YGD6]|uniref:Flp family type IVb pilin n=1 Tax=Nesterenkonia sp. YGD6 TaxID=2901231 RepID=UPI001F4D0F8F|nr:Flp family type IVb pilin [Nesterenkonia sp. YGD6]MCH8563450.1 Flp family type IVb pilin [Nesterenkonia sp. YGD6]
MNRAYALVATLQSFMTDRFEGRKDRGATAVEYGLLVGLIAVAIIGAVLALGGSLTDMFTGVESKLPAVDTGTGTN